MPRKLIAIAVLTLLVAAAAPSAGAAHDHASARAAGSCAHGDSRHLKKRRFLAVVRCLHNAARRARGLGALAGNRKLARAARRHARDMVRRHYFSHTAPDGSGPLERVRRAGYRGAQLSVGENILYVASPRRVTPREVIAQWMHSPPHRRNILRREWRDFGLGAASKAPNGAQGITLVAEFGARS
jgi:uncharacterized protein YkwD